MTRRDDPDVTVVKVYFPEEGPLQVHQSRVCPCPPALPVGFYWYGGTRKSAGRVPGWVTTLLENAQQSPAVHDCSQSDEESSPDLSVSEERVDDDTNPVEPESSGANATRQPSRYSLRARVAPLRDFISIKLGTSSTGGGGDVAKSY